MVRQARIKCICRSIKIQDLGLDFVQGQEMILTPEEAARSQDLSMAVRNNAVTITYEALCEHRREPEDKTLQKNLVRSPAPFIAAREVPKAAPAVVVDTDAIAQEVKEKLLEALSVALPGLLSQIPQGVSLAPTQEREPIKKKIARSKPEEPVFIPKDLVAGGDVATVAVESVETETDSIAAATALLRKNRRQKK